MSLALSIRSVLPDCLSSVWANRQMNTVCLITNPDLAPVLDEQMITGLLDHLFCYHNKSWRLFYIIFTKLVITIHFLYLQTLEREHICKIA